MLYWLKQGITLIELCMVLTVVDYLKT